MGCACYFPSCFAHGSKATARDTTPPCCSSGSSGTPPGPFGCLVLQPPTRERSVPTVRYTRIIAHSQPLTDKGHGSSYYGSCRSEVLEGGPPSEQGLPSKALCPRFVEHQNCDRHYDVPSAVQAKDKEHEARIEVSLSKFHTVLDDFYASRPSINPHRFYTEDISVANQGGGDRIRLLRNLSASSNPFTWPSNADIRTFSLRSAPKFCALSYSWGSSSCLDIRAGPSRSHRS
jgi:hypothetical protein